MKKIFFLLILALATVVGYAQMPTLPCTKVEVTPSILYKGVPNEIKITASLFAETVTTTLNVEPGELKLVNTKKYIIPTSLGTLRLTVKSITDQQTSTETFSFEVVELPNPEIVFIKENGERLSVKSKMSIQTLRGVTAIDADFNLKQILIEAQIKSFTMMSVKADGHVKEIISNNEKVNADLGNLLSNLTKKDFVIFKDFVVVTSAVMSSKNINYLCIEVE
jgi:hypothetical protein